MAKIKIDAVVDLACRLGVIEDTQAGRVTYAAWLRRDPAAAQAPLVAAMPKRAPAATGSSKAAVTRATHEPAPQYPRSWLAASTTRPHGHQVRGQTRVTHAGD